MKDQTHPIIKSILPIITLLALHTSIYAASISSIATGNWNAPSTWAGGVIPGAGDDVYISSGHTVTLNDSRSCNTLTVLSGGTFVLVSSLNQSGTFLNQGTFNWANGSFDGASQILNEGTMNLNTTSNHNTASNIINNAGGIINWNDGHLDYNIGGQTLTNYGTFNLIGNNPNNFGCGITIVNAGTVNKTAGTLLVTQLLDNQAAGDVFVAAGSSLTFQTGGTLVNSGDFFVAGTIFINGGSHTFNPGNTFGGTGLLSIHTTATTVTASAGFSPTFPTINQSANLSGGPNTALIVANGTTWNWIGDWSNFTSITNDGTLNINNQGNHQTPADITNNPGKTINWNNGHLDWSGGGQTLTNYGIFNLIGNNPNNFGSGITIVNAGTVNKTAGTLLVTQLFDNQAAGDVFVAAGSSLTFQTGGTLVNSGDVSVAGTINFYGGSHTFTPGNTFGGTGALNIYPPATTVTASAGFSPTFPTVYQSASLSGGPNTALIVANGTTWTWIGDWSNFTGITNDGTLNINNESNHQTTSNITNNPGKTINWNNGHLDFAGGGQTLTNYGTLNLIGNNLNNFGCNIIIANAGTVHKPAGTLTFFQPFDNQSTGVITGTGTLTFSSTFTNTGAVAPGSSIGNLILSRTGGVSVHDLEIEIQSNSGPGVGHDRLQTSPTTISGDLNVSLLNGFQPSSGATFTIFTYSSRTGAFASVSPSCWSISYGATSATITYTPGSWYADNDGDGYGAGDVIQACTQPANTSANNLDCDDGNSAVYPGAPEICNGIDDDCDGLTDDNDPNVSGQSAWYADNDGDGYGAGAPMLACSQPANTSSNNLDCNDGNSAIFPGAPETCNGIDDNCDGQIDEGVLLAFYPDNDGDGYGAGDIIYACSQPANTSTNNLDCDDTKPLINPGAQEICNGFDDDCDGLVDDSDPSVSGQSIWYVDVDNDGYGNPAVSIWNCFQPAGYVANNSDCNDGNANINPAAVEICNGIDDNCDGLADEGQDSDGDGTADCFDGCPDDPNKTAPGVCGCGIPDEDLNNNNVIDCLEGACNNVTDGGEIEADQIILAGWDAAAFTNVALPSGGTGTLEYIWVKWTNDPNNVTVIPGATTATYDPPVLTETTWFQRRARRSGCSAYEGWSNELEVRVLDPNACYRISSTGSLNLQVQNGSQNNGAPAVVDHYQAFSHQHFKFADAGGGALYIIPQHSQKVLQVSGGSQNNNAPVVQNTQQGLAYQKWQILNNNSNNYRFIAVHSGKALTRVQGNAQGTAVFQSTWTNSVTQRWRITEVICANGFTDPGLPGLELEQGPTAMKVFPNPAGNQATLHLEGLTGQEVDIRLVNQLGQEVHRIYCPELADEALIIDLSTLQNGLYWVRVETIGEQVTLKLMVTK